MHPLKHSANQEGRTATEPLAAAAAAAAYRSEERKMLRAQAAAAAAAPGTCCRCHSWNCPASECAHFASAHAQSPSCGPNEHVPRLCACPARE